MGTCAPGDTRGAGRGRQSPVKQDPCVPYWPVRGLCGSSLGCCTICTGYRCYAAVPAASPVAHECMPLLHRASVLTPCGQLRNLRRPSACAAHLPLPWRAAPALRRHHTASYFAPLPTTTTDAHTPPPLPTSRSCPEAKQSRTTCSAWLPPPSCRPSTLHTWGVCGARRRQRQRYHTKYVGQYHRQPCTRGVWAKTGPNRDRNQGAGMRGAAPPAHPTLCTQGTSELNIGEATHAERPQCTCQLRHNLHNCTAGNYAITAPTRIRLRRPPGTAAPPPRRVGPPGGGGKRAAYTRVAMAAEECNIKESTWFNSWVRVKAGSTTGCEAEQIAMHGHTCGTDASLPLSRPPAGSAPRGHHSEGLRCTLHR